MRRHLPPRKKPNCGTGPISAQQSFATKKEREPASGWRSPCRSTSSNESPSSQFLLPGLRYAFVRVRSAISKPQIVMLAEENSTASLRPYFRHLPKKLRPLQNHRLLSRRYITADTPHAYQTFAKASNRGLILGRTCPRRLAETNHLMILRHMNPTHARNGSPQRKGRTLRAGDLARSLMELFGKSTEHGSDSPTLGKKNLAFRVGGSVG